jgi:hypothetical protein
MAIIDINNLTINRIVKSYSCPACAGAIVVQTKTNALQKAIGLLRINKNSLNYLQCTDCAKEYIIIKTK